MLFVKKKPKFPRRADHPFLISFLFLVHFSLPRGQNKEKQIDKPFKKEYNKFYIWKYGII